MIASDPIIRVQKKKLCNYKWYQKGCDHDRKYADCIGADVQQYTYIKQKTIGLYIIKRYFILHMPKIDLLK